MSFKKRLISLIAGTGTGQVMILLAMPLLTRLHSPEDFGEFAAIMSVSSILAIVSTLRLDVAIAAQRDEERAGKLLLLTLLLSLSTAVLLMVVGALLYELNLVTDKIGEYPWEWGFAAMLSVAAYQSMQYFTIQRQDYYRLAVSKTLFGIVVCAATVLLSYYFDGSWALVAGFSAGYYLAGFYLAFSASKKQKIEMNKLDEIKSLWNENKSYPKLSAPAATINSIGVEFPLIFIAYNLGAGVAGNVSLANRAVLSPLNMVSKSWGQIFIGSMAGAASSEGGVYLKYKDGVRKTFIVFLCLVGVAVVCSFYLFPIVFGEQWSDVSKYIIILAPLYVAQLAVGSLSQTLTLTGNHKAQLAWDVFRVAVVVFSLFIPFVLGVDDKFVLLSYSIGAAASYLLLALITIHLLRKKVKFNDENI